MTKAASTTRAAINAVSDRGAATGAVVIFMADPISLLYELLLRRINEPQVLN
jgi:hypothetical protein